MIEGIPNIDLQWFSDEQPAPADAGVEAAAPPAAPSGDSAPVETTPAFHTYTGADGKKTDFGTADDLDGFLSKSAMFQSDYTRKTQALSAREKELQAEHDKRTKEHEANTESLNKAMKRYSDFETQMARNPMKARQMESIVNRPTGPDEILERAQAALEEKMNPMLERLDAFEADQKQKELEATRDQIEAEMAAEYSDFNKDEVRTLLNSLNPENLKGLYETMHKATRYQSPLEARKAVEQDLARKESAGLVSGGGSPPSETPSGFQTPQEATRQAYKDAGIQ